MTSDDRPIAKRRTHRKVYAFDPDWVVAPAASLQEWLDANGLDARIAAACVGQEYKAYVAALLQDVLDRKPLTNEHALALARCTQIPMGFWINLEHNYRVGLDAGKIDATEGEHA